MGVNPNHLCMGCMREKGAAEVCPACDWREGTPAGGMELAPRTLLNQAYLLGRVVGEGGFGITYLGWDLANQRRVAVKEYFPRAAAVRVYGSGQVTTISPQWAEVFDYGLQRFSEESNVLTLFRNHPCIVSCLDFQSANGTAYLVMEYLEGKTLAAYLRERNGRIGGEAALNVIMRVLDGLREVHHHGLLHRDISPENIFLTRTSGVKLLDFGAARFAMGERSQNLSVILKPGYAPPEQYLRHGRQGPPADLYATAATLYRAVTGTVPPDALERRTQDELEPLSRFGIAMEPHVEWAMLRAMSLEIGDRFKTAEDFQEALRTPLVATMPPIVGGPHSRVPSVFQAYGAGLAISLLMLLPLVLSSHSGQKGTTTSTPAPASTVAPAKVPAPAPVAVPAPPPAAIAGNSHSRVTYDTFQANYNDGRIAGDLAFRIEPFPGNRGCAVLALVDENGKYLERAPGKTFQVQEDFTATDEKSVISIHFDSPVPAAVTDSAPSGKISAQAVLFATACSVEDEHPISRSSEVQLRVPR